VNDDLADTWEMDQKMIAVYLFTKRSRKDQSDCYAAEEGTAINAVGDELTNELQLQHFVRPL
jgi:hypothetical protein